MKIKSEQCIEQCKCCLYESRLRFIWNSPVLTFKFIFQITKVCDCISDLNNCGIHVYENQVIMRARFR